MTRARKRNLGIAGGLALLAAIMTTHYVSGAKGSTKHESAQQTVPVLVATRGLSIGTPASSALASGAIALRRVPQDSLAADAVARASALRGEVVVQPIDANEQVTSDRFGTSGAQGLGSTLHGSLRAIAVPGDAQQLLAGMLKPGDHVDLVVNDKLDSEHPKTRIALRNLIVLQAPSDSGSSGAGGDSLSATVQLTDKQVQVLWWAIENGDWSFALRPAAKATSTAKAPAVESDVLAGR